MLLASGAALFLSACASNSDYFIKQDPVVETETHVTGEELAQRKERMQRAFDRAYPYALGLFEPTASDEILAQAGICPKEGQLQREWASAISPVLAQAGINIDENAKPNYGGRLGKHHKAMAPLLEGLQKVYKLDPAAKW